MNELMDNFYLFIWVVLLATNSEDNVYLSAVCSKTWNFFS